jgi:hypothetical protein
MRKAVCGSFLLLALAATSQLIAQSTPKPPQIDRLAFYVGNWTESGTMRADPTKPMQPIGGGETCRWAAGGYAVLCEEQNSGAGGGWEGVYILSYDAGSGKYHVHGTDKPGLNMHAVGEIIGNQWVWMVDPAPDGTQVRYVFTPSGNNARTMVVEVQSGTEWTKVVDMTYSRAK